tara:strand:+ start:228 stop:647 length:420 start_codon:yes stop_codon:yes gene_type:complete
MATTAEITITSSDLTSDAISYKTSTNLWKAGGTTDIANYSGSNIVLLPSAGVPAAVLIADASVFTSGSPSADKSAKLYVYNANAAGDTDYMTIAINTVVLGHVYPGDWCLIPWAAALDVTLTPKANTAVKAEYAILGGE